MIIRLYTTIILLLYITICCNPALSENTNLNYKKVLSNDFLIEYYDRYLSQDKRILALINWGKRDKETGFRMQDIYFFNISTKKIHSETIRNLLNKSDFWYIERDGISWDSNNKIYLAINYLNGNNKLYKYNLESNILKKIDISQSIKLLTISPDNKTILFVGNEKDKNEEVNMNLYSYNLSNFSIDIIDNNVDYFRPVWLLNDEEVIYRKNNNLYLKKLLTDGTVQLTDLKSGLIVNIQIFNQRNKLFIIRQKPEPDILIEKIENWMKNEKKDRKKDQPKYIKEFWEIDIYTFKKKLIKSFETMKGGIFLEDTSIIVSLPDKNETYHLWHYKNDGSLKQLTFGNVVDDLPIEVFKNNIYFRRNYKEIMALDITSL